MSDNLQGIVVPGAEIAGYELLDLLYEDDEFIVFRGIRIKGGEKAIIKTSRSLNPAPAHVTFLRQAYETAAHLNLPGVLVHHNFEMYGFRPVLILADFYGKTLRERLGEHNFNLNDFLSIAVSLVETLGFLHQKNIICNSLEPNSILIGEGEGALTVAIFNLRTSKNPTKEEALFYRGDLKYISPERTGRIYQTTDYRSDFYSLGLLFYEILTGSPPFVTEDSGEMIFSHLARRPPDIHELGVSVPVMLGEIVQKLLAKSVTERYPNTYSIRADLEKCLEQYGSSGDITPFFPGIRNTFSLPFRSGKLYGREKEMSRLESIFEDAARGAQAFVMISGYGGTGKTALVEKFKKHVALNGGNFISGKYEQFRMDGACNGFVQGFQKLLQEIIASPDANLARWKKELTEGLGVNSRVLIDMLPELERIVGPQPETTRLGAVENLGRFLYAWARFIEVFTSTGSPLVIFLDDLQWADASSYKLLTHLATVGSNRLMVIGAFRDNQLEESHQLLRTLLSLESKSARYIPIALEGLDSNDFLALIAEMLRADKKSIKEPAGLLFRKTRGNVFYMLEILRSLYQRGALEFDYHLGKWNWDESALLELELTENVVELMLGNMDRLGKNTVKVLKVASCLGHRFTIEQISILTEFSSKDIQDALEESVTEQMLEEEADENTEQSVWRYRFTHDRVQQAADSCLTAEERIQIHYKIAHRLFEKGPSSTESWMVWVLCRVNHLNLGSALIKSQSEKKNLIFWNFTAARLAKQNASYSEALSFLEILVGIMPHGAGTSTFKRRFEVFLSRIECEYLCGELEAAETHCEELLKVARSPEEQVRVYILKITLYSHFGRFREAVQLGQKAARLLGKRLSTSVGPFSIISEMVKARLLRGRRPIQAIGNIPPARNQKLKLLSELYMSITGPAYLSDNFQLSFVCGLKILNLTLRHGAMKAGPFGVMVSGMFGVMLGRLEQARRFGLAAIKLNSSLRNPGLNTKLFFLLGSNVLPWTTDHRRAVKCLQKGVDAGLQHGDLIYTEYCLIMRAVNSHVFGVPLSKIASFCEEYLDFARRSRGEDYKNSMQGRIALMLINTTCKFAGIDANLNLHLGNDFNETLLYKGFSEGGEAYAYHSGRLSFFYTNGDYKETLRCAQTARSLESDAVAQVSITDVYFYHSLAAAALYGESSKKERRGLRRILRKNRKKLGFWAKHSEANFLDKYLLTEAELARIEGRAAEAVFLYEKSAGMAHKYEHLQVEAFACERAAEFFEEMGNHSAMVEKIRRASLRYMDWGALEKVKALEKQYRFLNAEGRGKPLDFAKFSTFNVSPGLELDLSGILEACRSISSEINLDRLLLRLLHLMIKNTGAVRGSLLLLKDDKLNLEVSSAVNKESGKLERIYPEKATDVYPSSVVQYVMRTQQPVLSENASEDSRFSNDVYFANKDFSSILSVPIMQKGRLQGLVYLENNLMDGVFAPVRLEVVALMATQAAISIENAHLYEELERKVEERTLKLEKANTKLREQDQHKSILFNNISHEIRTPLTLILAPLETLLTKQAESTDEESRFLLKTMNQSGRQILRLVNDLLDLSKYEAGRMRLEPRPVEITEFVRNLAAGFQQLMESRGMYFEIKADSKLTADIDPEKLEKVVLNLLSNALKFTARGGVVLEIRKLEDSFEIAVADSGRGLKLEERANIFERYYQTEEAGESSPRGTGIGLALSREIVELHGGEITVESSFGGGSRFVFKLPLRQVLSEQTKAANPQGPDEGYVNALLGALQTLDVREHFEPEGRGNKPVLLIVDDSTDMQIFLSHILKNEYNVLVAGNGKIALNLARQHQPDVILSDIRMPDMDGFEFLEAVKHDASLLNVPFIFLTGEQAEQLESGNGYSADAHITKPLQVDELKATLKELLSNKA